MFGIIHHLPDTAMYWSRYPPLRVPATTDVRSKEQTLEAVPKRWHYFGSASFLRKLLVAPNRFILQPVKDRPDPHITDTNS